MSCSRIFGGGPMAAFKKRDYRMFLFRLRFWGWTYGFRPQFKRGYSFHLRPCFKRRYRSWSWAAIKKIAAIDPLVLYSQVLGHIKKSGYRPNRAIAIFFWPIAAFYKRGYKTFFLYCAQIKQSFKLKHKILTYKKLLQEQLIIA